jgi:hypothetical protein
MLPPISTDTSNATPNLWQSTTMIDEKVFEDEAAIASAERTAAAAASDLLAHDNGVRLDAHNLILRAAVRAGKRR